MRSLAFGLSILGVALSVSTDPAMGQDHGDGAHTNPPLHADYPDPDNIRVEGKGGVRPKASVSIGKADGVHLAPRMDFTSEKGLCGYGKDGETWAAIGDAFPLMWDWRTGTFQGRQHAVFCSNPRRSSGHVGVDGSRFVQEPPVRPPMQPPAAPAATEGSPIIRDGLPVGPAAPEGGGEGAAASEGADAPPIAGPLNWRSSGVLIAPVSDEAHRLVSVKDPTVVYSSGRWHVVATTANARGNWSMVYLSFKDWTEAADAKPYYMDANPGLRGYHCAPHLFYFRPHKKWYLIFQSQQPQYSTVDDLSKPDAWSRPLDFFASKPPGAPRLWIDYWIICDDRHAYLFFTGDNGRLYRSRTRIEEFPQGMSNPEIAIQETRETLFEGSMTYRIKGTDKYLMLVEGLGPSRYYRAYTSDRLDGEWAPIPQADTYQKPFAGINNVAFADGVEPWTKDVSHGELIRDGYDETMTIDPKNLQMLYQGRDPASGGPYHSLPYRLGILKLDETPR